MSARSGAITEKSETAWHLLEEIGKVLRGHDEAAVALDLVCAQGLARGAHGRFGFDRRVDGGRVTGHVSEVIAGVVGAADAGGNPLHRIPQSGSRLRGTVACTASQHGLVGYDIVGGARRELSN